MRTTHGIIATLFELDEFEFLSFIKVATNYHKITTNLIVN